MSDDITGDLERILAALTILPPGGFSLGGQPFQAQPAPPGGPGAPASPPVDLLAQQLYAQCYCQRFRGAYRAPPAGPWGPDEALEEALSAANASVERWESGWQIYQLLAGGQVLATKHGLSRALWPGEFISGDGPGAPPRPGATIAIIAPRESRTMQPGFYFAFGESPADGQSLMDGVRFYWNLRPSGAPTLVRLLTTRLNRFQLPFRLKVLSFRPLFYRLDSAVLFVDRRHCHITAALLAELYPALRAELEPETPLFTRRLAPGLGFAEEPGTGESFGTSRCRIVAEAIWAAYAQAAHGRRAQLQAIERQFAGYGLALARPHLRPGAVDHYEFPEYRQ